MVAPRQRRACRLSPSLSREEADARATLVADLVGRLRKAGREGAVESVARRAAAVPAESIERILANRQEWIRGNEHADGDAFIATKKLTFRELGEAWTSGALSRTYPGHVPIKATATDDAWRLEKHVYPHVEGLAVADFTLDHAHEILRRLSPKLSPASRRHVAQLMARVLKLGAYPCRIIPRSPIPAGFLSRLREEKALEYLYPDEDAKLLAHTEIPLPFRIMYGILAREGMRSGELSRLTFADLDLERGAVKLDENKTDDPRAWALDPGVALAVKLWKGHFRPGVEDSAFILVEPDIRKAPRTAPDQRRPARRALPRAPQESQGHAAETLVGSSALRMKAMGTARGYMKS